MSQRPEAAKQLDVMASGSRVHNQFDLNALDIDMKKGI
jgi:hypothetical protein